MSVLLALDQGSITTASDQTGLSSLTFNITTTNAFEYVFVDLAWCSTGQVSVQSVTDPANGSYFVRYIVGPYVLQPQTQPQQSFFVTMARFYAGPVGAMTFPVTATLTAGPTNGFTIQAYAYIGTNLQNPFDPISSLPMMAHDPGPAFTTPTITGVSTAAQATDVLLWHFATKNNQVGNMPQQGAWTNIATNNLHAVAFTAETDQMPILAPAQSLTLTSASSSSWVAIVDSLTDPPLYLAYGLGARRRM